MMWQLIIASPPWGTCFEYKQQLLEFCGRGLSLHEATIASAPQDVANMLGVWRTQV